MAASNDEADDVATFLSMYKDLKFNEIVEKNECPALKKVEEAIKFFVDIMKVKEEENKGIKGKEDSEKSTEDKKTPVSYDELVKMMADAAESDKHIKAVSTGHSTFWNNIASTDGCLIDTSRLKKCLSIDVEVFKDNIDAKTLCQVGAGATVEEVMQDLWPVDKRHSPGMYRVLENQTSGVSLSIAGTIATGAHGNGLRKPIKADIVQSFRMITIDGNKKVKQYQIERTNGISDRTKFQNKYKDVELIQDDEQFYASVVNIGCMGIACSFILKCEPAFYLNETYEFMTWADAKMKLPDLYKDESLYSFEIIASPYKTYGVHHVDICKLRRCPPPTQPLSTVRSEESSKECPSLFEGLIDALVLASNTIPFVIPCMLSLILHYLAKRYKPRVLNACEARSTLSGIIPKGFSDVRVSECCMKATSANDIIMVTDALLKKYDELFAKGQVVNVPFALRFTASSKAYMAMEYDQTSVLIEQSILTGTRDADETLRKFRNLMQTDFKGRPHWGMEHDMDAQFLHELYPKSREPFIKAITKFDPTRRFKNEFTMTLLGDY